MSRRARGNEGRRRRNGTVAHPVPAELVRPAGRVAMPRLPRLQAPGATVHVSGRCNNREFCFTTPADFRMLIAQLGEMVRTYEVALYRYALMANHLSHAMGSVRGKGPSLGPGVPIQFPQPAAQCLPLTQTRECHQSS